MMDASLAVAAPKHRARENAQKSYWTYDRDIPLGFGQSRFLDNRPKHGFRASEKAAVHEKFSQLFDDPGLGIIGHGRIGVFPIPITPSRLNSSRWTPIQ